MSVINIFSLRFGSFGWEPPPGINQPSSSFHLRELWHLKYFNSLNWKLHWSPSRKIFYISFVFSICENYAVFAKTTAYVKQILSVTLNLW